jgi:tetratricopeptide (TPR) repeat protein
VAVLLLVIYATQYNVQKFVSVVSVSLLTGLAALVAGALLGFLFGIPRALQRQEGTTDEQGRIARYAVNTNLEQISDWLTKILVGLGLIQLGRIGTQFSRLSTVVGANIGAGTSGAFIAGAEMVFFSIWGFLIGYLLTRTYLTAAFRAFDTVDRVAARAAREAASEVSRTAEARQREQYEIDAEALSLASELLNPGLDSPALPSRERVEEFEELLAKASPPIREQIFQQTVTQRTANWNWRNAYDSRDESRKRHERTVPVSRALVKVAADDHRFHSNLGYSLKDKENPDYDEAIRELSVAIELAEQRGDQKIVAWSAANRAQARLEVGKRLGYSAPWPNSAEIWADIALAEAYGRVPARIVREPPFERWRAQNAPPSEPAS